MEAGGQSISPIPSPAESRCDAFLAEHAILIRAASTRACPRNLGVPVEEIEQEVRLRLWKFLQSETEVTSPASLIGRIAVTAAIDAVRRVKARREQPLLEKRALDDSDSDGPVGVRSSDSSPESIAEGREVARKVGTALGRIPESRRKPVRLHLQGFTSEEIGQLLDYTETKARNLVYRGLGDLRRELRAEGFEHEAG
ncbi:MAG: RNA polymerase sigma factor [Thermoanaerobaculia bacterium]